MLTYLLQMEWLPPAGVVLGATSTAALGAMAIDSAALVELIFPSKYEADGTKTRGPSLVVFSSGFGFLCLTTRFVHAIMALGRAPNLSMDGVAASLLLVRCFNRALLLAAPVRNSPDRPLPPSRSSSSRRAS